MTGTHAGRRCAGRRERQGAGGLAHRVLWSFGGQLLSSSGNFLVGVVILTVASRAEFAAFSICFTSYLLAVLLYRALVAIPVTLLYSGELRTGSHLEAEENSAIAFGAIAACVSAACLAIASLTLDAYRDLFLILVLALPLLLYQDGARYVAFARGCPAVAAQSDGLWLVLQVAGFLITFLLGRASTASFFAAWALAGAIAGVMIGIRLHLAPRVAGAVAWVRAHWALCQRLLLECVINSGGVYVMLYGLVIVSNAGELGRLRAAHTLLGPVSVLLLGGAALALPESVRARQDSQQMRRLAVRLSLFLAGFTIVWGVSVYLTLPAFGPHLFPSAWASARPVIPLLVVFNTALGVSTGPVSGIRALGNLTWIVRARCASILVVMLVGFPAAAAVGANGALLGMALAESLHALAAWWHFDRLSTGAVAAPA